MAKLRIEPRDGTAFDLPLGTDEVTIGRGVNNTLHFRDPWLSRLHAKVVWGDGGHAIEDADSRNGTFLNGSRLDGARNLRDGDQVALGNVLIHYLQESAGQKPVSGFEMPESEMGLSPTGTLMISSEELQLERYRQAVRERAQEASGAGLILASLNEVAASLIAHYPLAELADRLLDLVLQAVPAQRGALLLRGQRGGGPLEVETRRGYDDESQVRISRTILEVAVEGRQAILTIDAQADRRFEQAESIMMQGIRSVLCVPITSAERVIGLFYLDHRVANEDFNENTLRLVGLIANLAAAKIENCWLLEDQNEKRRMEEQLAVGAQIQRGLLPASAPKIDGYDLAGLNSSCFEIGGDYYDFVPKEDGKLALVIADISGKGVAAALLMAVLQASLRALVHTIADPPELVRRLNRALVENSPDNRFATLFYGELDPQRHTLEYVSGGHNPCLLWTPGRGVETLDSSGPFIGLLPQAQFTSRVVDLAVGSTLLLYTDGVTELLTDEGEEFGVEPLVSVLEASGGTSAHDVIDRIHDRMHAYVGSDRFDDDSTLVVLRRLSDLGPPVN